MFDKCIYLRNKRVGNFQRVPFWGAKIANQVKISIKITCEITLRFTCDFFIKLFILLILGNNYNI